MLACQISLSFTHAETHIHWVSDAIQSSYPLSSPSPPAFSLLGIKVFPNELALCIRWPMYWSFSISPSNEYSELISFRIGWFDLFVVQGTLKCLLQHHIGKHQFFGVQPSLWSNSHIHVWLLERSWLWLFGPFWLEDILPQFWEGWLLGQKKYSFI